MQKIVFFCKIICTEQVKITCDFQNPMLSILKIVLSEYMNGYRDNDSENEYGY